MSFVCNLLVIVLGILTTTQTNTIGSFILVPLSRTYKKANEYCETTYNTKLVSIQNADKNEKIRKVARTAGWGSFWIGFNDIEHEGNWSWSDKSSSTFKKWKAHEPNNDKNEDAAEMLTHSGEWNDIPDHHHRYFVCNYPQTDTIESEAYKLVLTKKTYYQARSACFWTYNTHLATISSEKQNILIYNIGIQSGLNGPLWIGLSDSVKEGQFWWEDRTTLTFSNWLPNRPDNYGGQDFTLMLLNNYGKWDDNGPTAEYPFVCNYRRLEAVPEVKLTWDDANKFCQKYFHTQLGTITNADSYTAAKGISRYNNHDVNSGVWFGLRKKPGFRFVTNHQIEYSAWKSQNEPGDCVMFKRNSGWETADCSEEHYFVCDYLGKHEDYYCKRYLICETELETTANHQTYCPGIFTDRACIKTALKVKNSQRLQSAY